MTVDGLWFWFRPEDGCGGDGGGGGDCCDLREKVWPKIHQDIAIRSRRVEA